MYLTWALRIWVLLFMSDWEGDYVVIFIIFRSTTEIMYVSWYNYNVDSRFITNKGPDRGI
jgi:hypothetical protein